jgi:hypothetical protein
VAVPAGSFLDNPRLFLNIRHINGTQKKFFIEKQNVTIPVLGTWFSID